MGTRNRFNDSDTDTNRLPLFNLSDFPSLSGSIITIRNADINNVSQPNSTPNLNVRMAQPTSEVGEFIISAKDFPALPGTSNRDGASSSRNILGFQGSGNSSDITSNDDKEANYWKSVSDKESDSDSESERVLKQGLARMKIFLNKMINDDSAEMNTSKPEFIFFNDNVKNIPGGILKDQFGMAGLLKYIKMAKNDSDLVSLSLGEDITTLDLNLDSRENLFPTFGGPWAKGPCQEDDFEFETPPEYIFDPYMRNTLVPGKLDKYREELFLAAREL